MRIAWIDIAKGIGIILVVVGHSGNQFAYHYFFWFHMPLFFILSGMTLKKINTFGEYCAFVYKKLYRLVIPYISFTLLILLVSNYFDIINYRFQLSNFINSLSDIWYGGQRMKGYYAVFWFITCLLFTELIFALIQIVLKKRSSQITLTLFLFFIAHIEKFIIHTDLLWDIDVALFAIAYFSFGFHFKKYIEYVIHNIKFMLPIVAISLTMFLVDHYGVYKFTLDMKYRVYSNILLDLIIPISCSIVIFYISYLISKTPLSDFLKKLGTMSMVIMFLHFPINLIFQIYYHYGWKKFSLIGIVVPMFFYLLFSKIHASFFLGTFLPKKKTKWISRNVVH
ncbi:acyltransferase family protein [Sporolactobacillus shoreicorticis]|uniref:Acyltransferase family protein n=1 Tax=Sporolactobacillus shoreicorticis TaxID=1923877 RepID=A0ABW5S4V0_9BACL|nr:acyltransferase family protein [Sporolactobacillus shoreicorticis]MCO7124189.1 acyltransferase family protein [Sporolactobacillus shoreicorticis]